MHSKPRGFTIIELVIVIFLVAVFSAFALPRLADLGDAADRSSAKYQAAVLVSRDTNNVNACRIESDQCTDFVASGNQACVNAMATFAPQLALDEWEVGNIPSNTPREQWSQGLETDEAVFWVTRFQGDNVSQHPDDDWFDTWNARQPCILSRQD